jgi:predicted transcriptional regulator YheO
MEQEFETYLPIAEALIKLLYPYVEVVLHDLRTHRIVAIFNNFSKRQVGDDSLLEEGFEQQQLPSFWGPYYKTNWDGRRLKSITTTIYREQHPIGLMCVNMDVSVFEHVQHLMTNLVGSDDNSGLPRELFSVDWQEQINTFVKNYLCEKRLHRSSLSRQDKRRLVQELYQQGVFNTKHAATYVADILGISRATVYNYLNSYKQPEEKLS